VEQWSCREVRALVEVTACRLGRRAKSLKVSLIHARRGARRAGMCGHGIEVQCGAATDGRAWVVWPEARREGALAAYVSQWRRMRQHGGSRGLQNLARSSVECWAGGPTQGGMGEWLSGHGRDTGVGRERMHDGRHEAAAGAQASII
jgi:hypothetical protein